MQQALFPLTLPHDSKIQHRSLLYHRQSSILYPHRTQTNFPFSASNGRPTHRHHHLPRSWTPVLFCRIRHLPKRQGCASVGSNILANVPNQLTFIVSIRFRLTVLRTPEQSWPIERCTSHRVYVHHVGNLLLTSTSPVGSSDQGRSLTCNSSKSFLTIFRCLPFLPVHFFSSPPRQPF